MADIPQEMAKELLINEVKDRQIKVTIENATILTVHYLAQIYGRLGYIVKLLEEKNNG